MEEGEEGEHIATIEITTEEAVEEEQEQAPMQMEEDDVRVQPTGGGAALQHGAGRGGAGACFDEGATGVYIRTVVGGAAIQSVTPAGASAHGGSPEGGAPP